MRPAPRRFSPDHRLRNKCDGRGADTWGWLAGNCNLGVWNSYPTRKYPKEQSLISAIGALEPGEKFVGRLPDQNVSDFGVIIDMPATENADMLPGHVAHRMLG